MFGSNKRTAVGIDIGSHSIKVVELEKRDNQHYRLKNFSIQEILPEGQTLETEGPSQDVLTERLSETLSSIKIKPKNIKKLATSVGGQSVSVKQIRSISLGPEELESSLTFEARKYLPPDEAEAVIDFQVLRGDVSTSHMDILLVACTRKTFNQHMDLLETVGFKPGIVEVAPLAAMNSYLIQQPMHEDGVLIMLNIGAKRTSLIVFDPNGLFFTRDIAYGGNHFTDDVRARRKVDAAAAERIKKEEGIFPEQDPEDGDGSGMSIDQVGIELSRRTTEENLVNELNRSLRYYVKESGRNEFIKVLLTGGSAKIPKLDTFLSEKLRIPVEVYDPIARFELARGIDSIQSEPQLAQAVGLALRTLQ